MNGDEQLPEIDYIDEVIHVFGEEGAYLLINRIIGSDRDKTQVDAVIELYGLIPEVTAYQMPTSPEDFTKIAIQTIEYQKLVRERGAH
jgi:hypothetical protein